MGGLFPATTMPDRGWWRALWPDPDGTLRALSITAEMTVLDLCCGDGWFTAPLARLTGGKVYALDLDPAMLAAARAEVATAGATVRGWLAGDARDIAKLLHKKIDCALIANTFHGVPDQTGLVRAVARILNPDGRLAVVNWHTRPREETPVLGRPRGPHTQVRMTPDQTSAVVEPAGFVFDRVIELPPYHYGALFRLRSSSAS
ncbi:MAG: class I SAM-dependent methyltransferase [Rhodospirillales bacterium]|nr:MAG: class I SAM-dependent methyltransferase [Rhodospirillales bacterium]